MSSNYSEQMNYSAEKRGNVKDEKLNMNIDRDKNLNLGMDKDRNLNMDQNLNMNKPIGQTQLEKDLPRENKDLLQHQDRMSDLNRDKDFNRNKDFNTNKDWNWEKDQNKDWNKEESHGVVGNVVNKVKDVAADAAHKVKEVFSGDKEKDSDKIHGSDKMHGSDIHGSNIHGSNIHGTELGKEPLISDRTSNKERFDDTNKLNYDYDKNKNVDQFSSSNKSTGQKIKDTAYDAKEKLKDTAHDAKESLKGAAYNAKESLKGHNSDDFNKDVNINSNLAGDTSKDADWEVKHKKVIYKEEPASDARYHSTARGQNY